LDSLNVQEIFVQHSPYFGSAVLNILVIIGSTVVKLPQLWVIVSCGSVSGLSEESSLIEVFSGTLFIGYNYLMGFPFKTWGETAFVVVQTFIQVLLIWRLSSRRRWGVRIFFAFWYFGSIVYIFGGFLAADHLPLLGLAPTPCALLSRLPQIVQNYKQGHTGRLSFWTLFLMLGGNMARIFTNITQVKDPIILISQVVAAASNGAPLLQMLYYWQATTKVLDSERQAELKGKNGRQEFKEKKSR